MRLRAEAKWKAEIRKWSTDDETDSDAIAVSTMRHARAIAEIEKRTLNRLHLSDPRRTAYTNLNGKALSGSKVRHDLKQESTLPCKYVLAPEFILEAGTGDT